MPLPDKLDKLIVWEINKNKDNTDVWKIATMYGELTGQLKDKSSDARTSITAKNYKKIIYRLKKYCNHKYFSKQKNGNGKDVFIMDLNSIKIVKHKFDDGHKGDCLLIKI